MDRASSALLRLQRFLLLLVALLAVDLALDPLRPVVGDWWWESLCGAATLAVGMMYGAGLF